MSTTNLIIFTGYIGADAKAITDVEKPFVSFSCCEKRKDLSNWVECTLPLTETVVKQLPYLKRGTLVHIHGTPYVNAYHDKSNQPKGKLCVRVNGLTLLGSANDSPHRSDNPVVDGDPIEIPHITDCPY